MNRHELAQKISDKLYLRLSLSKRTIDLISSEIAKELSTGERVYLRKLGAFHPINRPAKRYYDIKTKKIKIKPSHKDVIFRPGKYLLRQIAKPKKNSGIKKP
jgi:nucleoid DNA-binding protein